MPFYRLMLLVLCSVLAANWYGAARAEVALGIIKRVDEDGTITMDSQQRLKLAGIHIVNTKAFMTLAKSWLGDQVSYQVISTDRYGEKRAIVTHEDQTLQAIALQKASALVYSLEALPQINEWKALERNELLVRHSVDARDAEPCLQQWCVVTGLVYDVIIRNKKAYINFAEDWKRDFTIYIDESMVQEIGPEFLAKLKDRNVQVRGFVDWYYGPRIVLHAKEMLDYAR